MFSQVFVHILLWFVIYVTIMGKCMDFTSEQISSIMSMHKVKTRNSQDCWNKWLISPKVGEEIQKEWWDKLWPTKEGLVCQRKLLHTPSMSFKGKVKQIPTSQDIKEEKKLFLGNISQRTVHCCLHDDIGYKRCRAWPKPDVIPKQINNTIAFLQEICCVGCVLLAESLVEWWGNRGSSVYRWPGSNQLDPKYTIKSIKFPDSIMA